jgi:hypothetical protein
MDFSHLSVPFIHIKTAVFRKLALFPSSGGQDMKTFMVQPHRGGSHIFSHKCNVFLPCSPEKRKQNNEDYHFSGM